MDNIVKFDKPYKFEGKEYDSLDLSGMEKMTVQDLIDIQKNIGNELAAMSVMEMTTSFAQEMAVRQPASLWSSLSSCLAARSRKCRRRLSRAWITARTPMK